ncbi:ethylbenzene dehydrogenase-related protein [Halohasta litorea]|uniref:Ethylbenzene dehydrogenase-related protein n=1 Tax=Halohasta litorea TaxID=869891 RepID=A0ABD6DAQ3_9EURY|nr:ethylbenzene dehydrogenase-related protein [Halohasta litorea]
MKRNELLLAVALAAVVAGGTVLLPPVVGAQTEPGVPVEFVETSDGFDSPTGGGWDDVQTSTLPLSSAGADVPSANDVTVEELQVASVRTDERIYVRTSWADPTRDTSDSTVREFDDNVAIQLPSDSDEQPPIAMGSSDNPVNVWYWSGSGNSEELLAGGPGSTTPFEESQLRTEQEYADGRWFVVFSRPLDPDSSFALLPGSDDSSRTTIPRDDADLDVAVAVWNGSNMEVAGQKSASQWHRLAVSSGPPAYERFLWVIAGVAIVLTTIVTIEGVRRTRGDE